MMKYSIKNSLVDEKSSTCRSRLDGNPVLCIQCRKVLPNDRIEGKGSG
jgi:hypothetical protein